MVLVVIVVVVIAVDVARVECVTMATSTVPQIFCSRDV